jgi:hypothetical protein
MKKIEKIILILEEGFCIEKIEHPKGWTIGKVWNNINDIKKIKMSKKNIIRYTFNNGNNLKIALSVARFVEDDSTNKQIIHKIVYWENAQINSVCNTTFFTNL